MGSQHVMITDKFKDRFAVNEDSGSYKLKADGCMNRWKNTSRDDEMRWDTQRRDANASIYQDKDNKFALKKKRTYEQFLEDQSKENDDEER